MIPVSRVSWLVSRLFATLMMVLLASSSFAQQSNPFPTATPERLKKTAAAYRARAELVPPEMRSAYVTWADYYDSMAALEPGAPVPAPPKILPGATAPSQALAEGSTETKPGISTLEAISIAIDVARNPGSFAQGALDAFMARQDEAFAQMEAKFKEWKQAQAELRQRRGEISAWCVAHADPSAQAYIAAAKTGDLDTVRRWIEDGNDPNACDELGNTALEFAATPSLRNPAAGQSPAATDHGTEPQLDQAAIDKLVDAALQGDKDAMDQVERLWLQTRKDLEGATRLSGLVHKITDAVTIENNKYARAIILDMAKASKAVVKKVSEAHISFLPSNVVITRYLLQHGADIMAKTVNLTMPLDSADRWSARLLIEARAAVNMSGSETSPIKQAAMKGNTQLALLLMASGANPALDDSVITDEGLAHFTGFPDVGRILAHFKKRDPRVSEALSKIARPGTGAIPLNYAASSGGTELVQRYLDSGVNADACDDFSWTPLMNAAQADNIDVMKLLLDKGASINAVNAFGQTALMLAIRTAHMKAALLLLERGADPRPKDIFNIGANEWLSMRTQHQTLHQMVMGVGAFTPEDARVVGDQLKQAESGRKGR